MSYCQINTEEYFLDIHDPALFRSSRPDILYKIDVPKNLAKPAEKHLGGSPPNKTASPSPQPHQKRPQHECPPTNIAKPPRAAPLTAPLARYSRTNYQKVLKNILKKFSKFLGEYLCRSLLLIKLHATASCRVFTKLKSTLQFDFQISLMKEMRNFLNI